MVLNSSVPNAWALPGGKIAINRGLLTEMNSEAELAAVLGHEIVHAAARHSARQMSRGMLLQAAVIGTAIMSSDSDYANLAIGGANVGAQLISQRYGRAAELESDLYGMRYMSRAGYDPQGAVELQADICAPQRGSLHGLAERVVFEPSTVTGSCQCKYSNCGDFLPEGRPERIAIARPWKRRFDTKPAYDVYDEGRKALAEKDHGSHCRKPKKPSTCFPKRRISMASRRCALSLPNVTTWRSDNYDIAIRRRQDFFQYYLQRGLAKEKLGDNLSAQADLEKSNELFPTRPPLTHSEISLAS